jgi:hypothetical protein
MRFSTTFLTTLLSLTAFSTALPTPVSNADVAVAPLARDAAPLALAAITAEDWDEKEIAFIENRDADADAEALDLTIAAREPATPFESTLLKFVEESISAREADAEPARLEKRQPTVNWQPPNAYINKPTVRNAIHNLVMHALTRLGAHVGTIVNGWHTSPSDQTPHATVRLGNGQAIHVYKNGVASEVINGHVYFF